MNGASKYLNWIASITLVIAAILLVGMLYLLMFDANPPIEVESPVPVDREVYQPGDEMFMTATYCRYSDGPATIFPQFVNRDNDLIWSLDPVLTNLSPGCKTTQVRSVIPEALPPGIYRRESRAVYDVNPLADRVAYWFTDWFEIVEVQNE